ncbi:hypothetical protein B0H13DRAFT_1900851 [Mycena leptocephala]|nr:hypothetical protein B0H13DRAFT_1900851 [Mycena leptocephala]
MFVATWSHDAQNHAQEMERGDNTILGANHAGDEISVMDMDLGDASARDHQLGYQGRRDCTKARRAEERGADTDVERTKRSPSCCARCKNEDEEMSMGKGRNAATASTDTGGGGGAKPEARSDGEETELELEEDVNIRGWLPFHNYLFLAFCRRCWRYPRWRRGSGARSSRMRSRRREGESEETFLSEQQRRIDKHGLSGEGEGVAFLFNHVRELFRDFLEGFQW